MSGKMLNKIIKRAHKKSSKWEFDANSNGYHFSEVVESHASRAATNSATLNLDAHNVDPAVAPPISGVIEILPPLREVEVSEATSIFLRKIKICSILFDFSDNLKSVREKEIKRRTLNDLVDILQSGSFQLSQVMQEELIRMVSVNIFRCLPPASHESTWIESVDPEEDNPYKDQSWPHLQIVYEILLNYIVSSDTDIKVARRYIDHIFVLKLLDLFDSEDQREREYLKTILHRIYGKFMVHRPFIRKAINNIFYQFIFETERHNAIAELLEILGSIINGFALPMKEEHKLFLIRALVPLHKPKCISTYHQQLSYCITQFVEKDHRLADPVIKGLLKYWPVTNCQKEVLFIRELEDVLEVTQSAEFQQCMVPLFRQIGRCLNSPQFQVAERALYLWKNEYIISLIGPNRNVVFPLIFEALEKNMKGHWSESIYGMSANLRRMFLEMDAELFKQCQRQYSENEARATELDEQRKLIWNKLEAVAAKAVRDDMVLVI